MKKFVRSRCIATSAIVLLSLTAAPVVLATSAGAVAAATSSSPERPRTVSDADRAEITDLLTRYATARATGDTDAILECMHEAVSRYTVSNSYWGEPSDDWVLPVSREIQILNMKARPADPAADTENIRAEIEIYDAESTSASARVAMDDNIELVHLARMNGSWIIVDSLIEPRSPAGGAEGADREDPAAATSEDLEAIVELATEYCRGFYVIDGERVRDTCHPMLSKRSVVQVPQLEMDVLRRITWEEIRILGDTYNRTMQFDPETARLEVDVYRADARNAAVKMTAANWFDYMQLARVNGEWTIVNIMFEGLPDDRAEPAPGLARG